MNVEIKTFHALPCTLEVFAINGKIANMDDFGDGFDHDERGAEPYCCGNWKFDIKKPTEEVLAKYGITKGEYLDIAFDLQEKLNVGRCGWCS